VASDVPKVLVIGPQNEFESYTHPAKARKLLKEGKAQIVSKHPFKIRLKGAPERRSLMRKSTVTNFTKYFSQERDVYVQNTGSNQISLQFEPTPGRIQSFCIPATKDPLNLTQYVAYDAIKNSPDIRAIVNRKPPVLRLLEEDEYIRYYQNKAEAFNTTLDEEIDHAQEEQYRAINHIAPVEEEVVAVPKSLEDLEESRKKESDPEDNVSPAVQGLIAQVASNVPDDQKMKAREMMGKLVTLEDSMTMADLEVVSAQGHHPTVRKWAKKKISERMDAESDTSEE